ncbi:MAG: T9SS type A sorting domain-containing protein, partial [Bacteroidales bacterium]|nr:T9SS type A sorting domain-containing protein [Bacteroidales bacterium]
ENTATVAISVYPKYEFTDNHAICQGDVYSWHGNNYSVSGTYYDSLQTINGCDSVYILHLTVNPLPNITASTNLSLVCSGSPATLTAGGGVSYEWSTTQTGGIITVNPTTATTYTVTGTDANGCENTASVSISVNPLPNVQATATPNAICIGDSTIISASGAITYEWDNGETTESFTVAPDETTTYVVTGTDAIGCENTAEITVIVNPLPLIMITADNTTICSGQSVTLTASSDVTGTTYLWNNGLTDAIITQYPTDNTTYTVTATTPAGCESTADIDITVNPSPTVDLGEDIVQCGGTVTLDAGAGFSSYQWNPPLSTSQTMIVGMSGTYYVTVTNEYDCSATDDIVVTISNVTVSLAETENGLEATIDPIVSGNYTWYTCDDEEIPGVTEAIYTNPTIGECYYVVFTDEYDCEFISNQVTVTSIADNVLSNAIVYPVPATDKVIVELINNNGAEVYLYDMLGQLVNSYKMDDNKLTIDVSKLSGNFLLKVITPDNTVNNFRIVITK